MKTLLFCMACCLPLVAAAQTYTVQTVPNNKLTSGSYVSNPDNIISEETVQAIDSMLAMVEQTNTGQVAVVVLNSIGENSDFDFSQELFNDWGIGRSENNNGLLILFVLDQRTVRFHTGDGLEGVLPDATCKRIQRESMVPYFKEGDYDQGILHGVAEVVRLLRTPGAFEEITTDLQDATSSGENVLMGLILIFGIVWIVLGLIIFIVKYAKKRFKGQKELSSPKYQISAGVWFLLYIVTPMLLILILAALNDGGAFIGGMYAYLATTTWARKIRIDNQAKEWLRKNDFYGLHNLYQTNRSYLSGMRFLFPFPLAFIYPAFKRKIDLYRNHPRNCRACGNAMKKLDEHADNVYLQKGQVREEELKSVDYDVWFCESCQAHDTYNFHSEKTKYEKCPKCTFFTYHQVSNKTITAATTSYEGIGEEIKACKFCQHRHVRRYSIARLSSSSSSGGSSSGGSGSWGGGSSGGGGASSSW